MKEEGADSRSSAYISPVQRLVWYGALWVLAAIAIQVFLKPEGLTETNLSEIQQRIRWPFYTPLMVAMGLAAAFARSAVYNGWAISTALSCFVIHGFITLTRTSARSFALMILIHAALLGVAVICFLRFARMPTGT